jgi:hypothetical protein
VFAFSFEVVKLQKLLTNLLVSFPGSIINNISEYNKGEIGAGRLTYRLTGETASFFSGILTDALIGSEAGPWGTVAGVVIGVATPGGEMLYDKAIVPAASWTSDWFHEYIVEPISNLESALKSGWLPH